MSEFLMKHDKKVCIIVPVYNAEKYLGYCLNSILSQTYTNWTAILVDDGSTDSSAQICRHYEELDSRFRLVTKPNGGVSSARNAGLELAEGDYLEFLDSDDCLTADALEKQVALALKYETPLVIMDIQMVDFTKPEASKVMLTSAWLEQSPCLLTAAEFRAKKMQLVWFTVLLECLHAKLYDLSLWKCLNLRFPEDLSLGEDFVTNMKYFDACESAVFVRECGHYYNCITESSSLTHKYRADLFEIKMHINEELEKHLGGRQILSARELDAFYCYVASNGLMGIEKEVLDSGKEQDALVARIAEMLDHELFYECICNASYIPDRFQPCRDALKAKQYDRIIQTIRGQVSETQDTQEVSPAITGTPVIRSERTLLNRIICKILKTLTSILKEGKFKTRLLIWEHDLVHKGMKASLKLRFHNHRRPNMMDYAQLTESLERLQSENHWISQMVHDLQESVREQNQEYLEQLQAGNHQMNESLEQLRTENSQLDQSIHTKLDFLWEETSHKIENSTEDLRRDINGYIWNSEQRIHKYTYEKDINDLRQKKKAIMLATAEHVNIGDAAITLAEQIFLQKYFPAYYQVEVSTYEFTQKEAWLHAIMNHEDIIFLNGGGNMGDVYLAEEVFHRKIVELFPDNKIIIFPQTIYFTPTEAGCEEREKSAKVYNQHKDLTLYVRGEESLQFAQTYFTNVKTALMPDMVHILKTDFGFERKGALLCLRQDSEGVLTEAQHQKIVMDALSATGSIERSTNIHDVDITRDIRAKVVREELMRFARHQVVVTDRLHGMLFSAITGTPCVVISSFNQKIREYYNTFFADCRGIIFVDRNVEQIDDALNQALQAKEAQSSILEQAPYESILTNIDSI